MKSHRQHAGELFVQSRRHVPPELTEMIGGAIHDEMTRQHAAYYSRLQFLPLGVADDRGRPWTGILCNPVVKAESREVLSVVARVDPHDPFVRAVCAGPRPFAGVAIDLARRSRVKIAGSVEVATLDGETLRLTLRTNEHMGNCPKYITVRELRPLARTPVATALGATLSAEARDVLRQASTVFIATEHSDAAPGESDMGVNHRGGPKGFVRYFEDERGAHLVLPDYSGNRFYQSLGNIETDPVIGLAVPDFASGALLQLTGRARNLFDDDAARVMPGATLVTLMTIDEAVLTAGALDLELVGGEQLSPYNPRLRLLASEVQSEVKPVALQAQLVAIARESTKISTFTFSLSAPAELVAGGYAIFDFSRLFDRSYQHMNERDPQSLNDDYIRSFTVSRISRDRRQISITVKKSGVISSYLHALATSASLEVDVLGFGGSFDGFENGAPIPHMVWIAGGVGITPFLAMYRALRDSGQPMPTIELFYSCRGDEAELVRELTDVKVHVFDSARTRRVRGADFGDLDGATVFVCGPEGYMDDVRSWLEPKVDPSRLRFEHFNF